MTSETSNLPLMAICCRSARGYKMIKLTVCRRSCTRQGIIREIFGCVKSVRKSYADYTARNILAYLHCFNEYDENIKKYIYSFVFCWVFHDDRFIERSPYPRMFRVMLQSEKITREKALYIPPQKCKIQSGFFFRKNKKALRQQWRSSGLPESWSASAFSKN